ncbi:uncharacterized protein METZ01_LOCUS200368 [marine metagenome]|uniref:Uncharacterized protein n=1 Tax=marine metagenome TaxID=408172 RepID=A0A382EBS5_9ZZZZ
MTNLHIYLISNYCSTELQCISNTTPHLILGIGHSAIVSDTLGGDPTPV